MRPTLVVLIAPDGTPTVEVQGCPGPSCRAVSRPIREALGETAEDLETPEYYQAAPAQSRVRLDQS